MKEILTEKEILALLGTCPLLTPSEYADKKSCQLFRERQVEWATNFEAKLEAFLEDSVSRAQIQKLTEEFPQMPDKRLRKYSYALPRFTQWLKEILEWKKRLEDVTEK